MKNIRYIIFIILIFSLTNTLGQYKTVEVSGDIVQLVIPAAALTSTFVYPSNDKPHWQFIKTFAAANLLTQSLKYIIDERRPDGGKYSFPSGHTTAAFSAAAFLQLRYGWKIGIPAYLLAGYVGFSRIYARKHYYWDVLAGASIGISSALIFTKRFNKENINLTFNRVNRYNLIGIQLSF